MAGEVKPKGGGSGETKKRLEASLKSWLDSGSKGIFAPWSAIDGKKIGGGGGGGGKGDGNGDGNTDDPEKEDPPLPPLDPTSGRPASNNWPDIVKFYFPKGAGTQYKDGGLVRGGGCAAKGRGRGKIV